MPKVSVIIITYNRANLLPLAIESVLFQSFSNWELIIIDDGSTDNTSSVVERFLSDQRIIYHKNDINLGIGRTRNIGLRLAQGEYVAILDSDDEWCTPTKLQDQVGVMNADHTIMIVGANGKKINSAGTVVGLIEHSVTDHDIRSRIMLQNQFIHSSVVFRRAAALQVGGYNEHVIIGEEYDLWLRLGRIGKFYNLSKYLVNYRIHNKSVSVQDRWRGATDTLKIVKHYHDYPNYFLAVPKGYARLFYSLWLIVLDKFRF